MASAVTKKMPYVRVGKSGLKVSKLILGCMSYGNKNWANWVLEEEEALEHIKFAWDAGINTFDTANVYSNGESERILGVFLKKHEIPREEVVILTKVFMPVGKKPDATRYSGQNMDQDGWANQHGLNRKHIFESIKLSLKRLDLEYVDVLQCHRFDPETPIEETMQALHDVVQAGYARYIGMSSCWAYQFAQMQNYAIQKGLTPFISMQNFYNAAYREEEREMIPTLEMFGVGAIPWSPLARGFLTRPVAEMNSTTRSQGDPNFARWGGGDTDGSSTAINKAIEAIAKERGATMAQVACAWNLSKSFISAPIVGSTKIQNLKELIDAVDLKLTEAEIKRIEEPYRPCAVKGHT